MISLRNSQQRSVRRSVLEIAHELTQSQPPIEKPPPIDFALRDQVRKEKAVKSDKSAIVEICPPTKCISIGNGKHIKVCNYLHKPYVNIRDYIITSDGQLYATKRGILFHPEEWKQLKKGVKEIDQEPKLV